jgi:hypothetical protein
MTALTAAEVSEGARAFLAAVSVAPEVLELRPDYRVLVMVAEGLEPGSPDEISGELPEPAGRHRQPAHRHYAWYRGLMGITADGRPPGSDAAPLHPFG